MRPTMDSKRKLSDDASDLRKRAEDITGEIEVKYPDDLVSIEKMLEVLHELRVHQIELEMQNESLRRAQGELDAERARYFDLYELAPIGYCTINEHWLILQANLMTFTVLGLSGRSAIINQPFSKFVFEEDQDLYHLQRKQLFKACVPMSFDLRLVKENGTPFWVQLDALAGQNDSGEPEGRVVLKDINERKRNAELMDEIERRFRTLANCDLALIWTSGTDKLCDYFNEPWLAFTGRTFEQEVGNGWAEGVHPDDFARCLETYVTAFDRREPFDMEYRLRHASGGYRLVVNSGMPRWDTRGKFLGYICRCIDTTERVKQWTP